MTNFLHRDQYEEVVRAIRERLGERFSPQEVREMLREDEALMGRCRSAERMSADYIKRLLEENRVRKIRVGVYQFVGGPL